MEQATECERIIQETDLHFTAESVEVGSDDDADVPVEPLLQPPPAPGPLPPPAPGPLPPPAPGPLPPGPPALGPLPPPAAGSLLPPTPTGERKQKRPKTQTQADLDAIQNIASVRALATQRMSDASLSRDQFIAQPEKVLARPETSASSGSKSANRRAPTTPSTAVPPASRKKRGAPTTETSTTEAPTTEAPTTARGAIWLTEAQIMAQGFVDIIGLDNTSK